MGLWKQCFVNVAIIAVVSSAQFLFTTHKNSPFWIWSVPWIPQAVPSQIPRIHCWGILMPAVYAEGPQFLSLVMWQNYQANRIKMLILIIPISHCIPSELESSGSGKGNGSQIRTLLVFKNLFKQILSLASPSLVCWFAFENHCLNCTYSVWKRKKSCRTRCQSFGKIKVAIIVLPVHFAGLYCVAKGDLISLTWIYQMVIIPINSFCGDFPTISLATEISNPFCFLRIREPFIYCEWLFARSSLYTTHPIGLPLPWLNTEWYSHCQVYLRISDTSKSQSKNNWSIRMKCVEALDIIKLAKYKNPFL